MHFRYICNDIILNNENMKNATFKKLLFSTVLCATSPMLQAQNPSFERDFSFRDTYGWANSWCTPIIADFTDDGINDLWLEGEMQSKGWTAKTVFAEGKGKRGDFNVDYESLYEIVEETIYVDRMDTIWLMNEDGTDFAYDDKGNKIIEKLEPVLDPETGKQVVDTIVKENQIDLGMKSGLPKTKRNYGSQPIDYNQDGLVDYIVMHPGGLGDIQGYKLVRNDGAGRFTVIEDEALAALKFTENPKKGDQNYFNQTMQYASLVVGDYDKDGYPDLLIQNETPLEGRWTRLLRNINGERFEEAKVFKPLPFDQEIAHQGLYEEVPAGIDEETSDPIPGYYLEDKPTYRMKPMNAGSVCFYDMDNDGWLDIIITGYVNGRGAGDLSNQPEEEPGGDCIRFYHNQTDGTFQDVTDQLIPAAVEHLKEMDSQNVPTNTLRDVFKAWGSYYNTMIATDYNQDGVMDILYSGPRRAGITSVLAWVNIPEKGKVFNFQEEITGMTGVVYTSRLGFFYADFNGDDYPDLLQRGYSSAKNPDNLENELSWCRVFDVSQGSFGMYAMTSFGYTNSDTFGGFQWVWSDKEPTECAFGDVDDDGKLDLAGGAYENGTDNFVFSYNSTDYIPEAPSAPSDVKAVEMGNGEVLVTWTAGYLVNQMGKPMNNVYIVNQETGKKQMLVPANMETGKQHGYSMFGAYATNYDEDIDQHFFKFTRLPKGKYTVGVQSVGYSYLASEFVTTEVTVTEGWNSIESVKELSDVKINVEGNNITVRTATTVPVEIYNVAGLEVATGMTNASVIVNGKGVFLVKVGNEIVKIIK